jgi:hypothetical protein
MRPTFCLLAVALSACGTPDTGSVDKYIKQLAQAQCQWEFRCCTDAEIKVRDMMKYSDEATCEKFAQLALEDSMYLARLAVSQGRAKVDDAMAQACVAKQQMKMCNTPPGQPPPVTTMGPCEVDPCTVALVGSTGTGDACLLANECAKGNRCVASGAGNEGACVPYQKENEICNSSADCDPSVCNIYCAHKDFQCHVRSPIGGPCAYTVDPTSNMPTQPLLLECDASVPGIYCDPASSTCKMLPGNGEACLSPPPPGSPSCNNDPKLMLSCDLTGGMPGVCRGLAMAGEDCTTRQCAPMLMCDRSMTPNVCKAPPTLGQPCPNGQCQMPYICNFNMTPFMCVQPGQLGDMCSFQNGCDTTLFCDTQAAMPTCKAKLPDGSTCTSSQMCLSNICTFMGTTRVCATSATSVQCIGR